MRTAALILFTCAIFLIACEHEAGEPKPDNHHNIANFASIHNLLPQSNAVFNDGDSLSVSADLYGLYNLHGYELIIHKHGDTTKLHHIDKHDHNDTLYVREKWKINVPSTMSLDVDLTVALNHDGDTAFRRIPVQVIK